MAEEKRQDEGKPLRWQIRSDSLHVLEQVYAMDPFPGLETRKDLARQLNVLPRQVQVWFQNKRQRERKISRALGLFSTPGLPDTPAAAAAKTAAERRASQEASGTSATASCDGNSASTADEMGGLDGINHDEKSGGSSTCLSDVWSMAIRRGVALRRAASCPDTDLAMLLKGGGDPPLSLDDNEIPLGFLSNNLGMRPAEGDPSLPGDSIIAPDGDETEERSVGASTRTSRDGIAPHGTSARPANPASCSKQTVKHHRAVVKRSSCFDEAEQMEAHCRAAVAAARAALGGDSNTNCNSFTLMANMGLRLPFLQSVMNGTDNGPSDSFDGSISDLPDDLSQQLAAELLLEGTTSPLEPAPPRSVTALLDHPDDPAGSARRAPGGRLWVKQSAIKKRAVPRASGVSEGIPLVRSGVSGLLDDLNLGASLGGDGFEPDSGAPAGDAEGDVDPDASNQALAVAEASMQAAADEYVQVITSASAPFPIVFASAAWLALCEYEAQSQVIGETIELVEGPLTQRREAELLNEAMRAGRPLSLNITHHTRSGKPFSHDIRLEPLRDSQGKLHCFQCTSSNIVMLDAEGIRLASEEVARANAAHAASTLERTDSVEQMNMSRSHSGLRIHEMLDLFAPYTKHGEASLHLSVLGGTQIVHTSLSILPS